MPVDYQRARIIVVMGICGCGKSTIGRMLSQRLSADYFEGDDYHSDQNREKMSSGIALTDDDRWPWLNALSVVMRDNHGKTIASCSSLKRCYRDYITNSAEEPVLFVHLHGSRELIASRLSDRKDHFMNTDLLDSQLATLEPPGCDEYSFAVDVALSVDSIVEKIATKITGDVQ